MKALNYSVSCFECMSSDSRRKREVIDHRWPRRFRHNAPHFRWPMMDWTTNQTCPGRLETAIRTLNLRGEKRALAYRCHQRKSRRRPASLCGSTCST
jgi:hypothetical protein